jgi:hypothetical protein
MTAKCLRIVCLVYLLAGWGSEAAAASAAPAHIEGVGSPALADGQWLSAADAKLSNFEATHGIRILIQFHAKSPPDNEDKNPGDYMRALSAKLGVIRDGVLAVHFADDPDWRVWIGDDLTPIFVGTQGTAKGFTESGAMHEAKEPFLKAAMAKAAAQYSALQKSDPSGTSSTPGKLLTLQADALIDGLFAKLVK